MSGAGRSTASATLEDLGWFVIDNVPAGADHPRRRFGRRRLRGPSPPRGRDRPRRGGRGARAASRSSRTCAPRGTIKVALPRRRRRRAHPPLRGDAASPPVPGRVRRERHLPGARGAARALRGAADVLLETGDLTSNELRRRVAELFEATTGAPMMRTAILSFGYKFGMPRDVDVVFDCRFLPNPHWVEALRDAVRARRPRPRLRARQRRDAALRRRGDRHARLAAARPSSARGSPTSRSPSAAPAGATAPSRSPRRSHDASGRASRPSTGTWRGERASRRRGRRRATGRPSPCARPSASRTASPAWSRSPTTAARRVACASCSTSWRSATCASASSPRGPELRPRHRLRAPLHAGRARRAPAREPHPRGADRDPGRPRGRRRRGGAPPRGARPRAARDDGARRAALGRPRRRP